jgi:hypothetical protein
MRADEEGENRGHVLLQAESTGDIGRRNWEPPNTPKNAEGKEERTAGGEEG